MPVIVTNTSSHPCTIFGYGCVEMFSGGDRRPVHIVLNRLPQFRPTLVTLKPGEKAHMSLTWEPPSGRVGDPQLCTAFVGFAG